MNNIAKLFALMALLVIGANKSELQAAVLIDNIYYEIDSTGTSAYVRQSINTIETANILDVVNIDGKDYPVTSIGSGAFSLRKNLVSVNIGQNITTIGESAFLYCSLLPSVSLPAGLKSIGNSAFAYCTSLSSVSLPAGLKSVGNYAFAECTSLSSVVIPDGVTSLGEHVFVNCSKLETVVLPSSLTSLGYSAFTNCSSLKSIDIPGSLATISAMVFEDCSSLASVTLNEGLQAIESGAFRDCVALESITFPESFAFIKTEVFSGCTSLLSVTMKGSTPPVPPSEYWGTFSGETLKSGVLTVPAGSKEAYKASRVWGGFVNIIEEGVAVEIVDGLRFVKDAIYYEVVSAADKTVEVTFGGETPTEIMGEYTGNVVVPQTVNYENIDFKVIGVCDGAFYRCYSLVSVTLPEGMKYIGESAFGQCYELASVTLPEGLETIGYAAFSECSLTSVTLPASLTSLDAHAFSQCANVSSIKVKEGNTVYDSRNNCNAVIETKSNKLIWGCYNTVVPKGVTSIGDWAFRYCSNLTSITLPAGVTSIGGEAFYYCKKMTSIVIPESVTSLGNKAFMGCESLKSIVLPPNMSYMDTGTFYGCASLATVVLPSNLESIGYDAFCNCSSLASITIPASVQSVDSYAFYDCLSLDSLFMERQTPPVAYDYTFNTFTNTVLTVPVGAKSAYQSANVWKKFATILEKGENEMRDGDKFEKNGMFYTILSVEDKTVEVTFKGETYSEVNNEYSGEVIVPQTVNYEDIDFRVVGIGLSAFDQCSAVTSVVLPNSITYIGAGAFNGTSISSITLPASITTVDGYAFYNCRSLASVILKGSTPPTVYDASFNTYETTVLIVPLGAKSAYQSANVWKNFATIREEGEGEIKDGDKFVKDRVYYKIVSVMDKTVEVTFKGETYDEVNDDYSGGVIVPQTVNYEDIDFKVVSIGKTAFAACENLKSVTISGNVKTIGNSAFERCSKLSAVTIPEGVTSIGTYAFARSTALSAVNLPSTLTDLGGSAFLNCSSLKSIDMPASLLTIGDMAFKGCSSLEAVNMKGSTPPTAYDNSFTTSTYETTVLTVPVGAKSAYQSADVWKKFVTILEEGVGLKDGDKFKTDGIYYTIISVEDKTVEVTFKGETYSEVNNEYSGEVIVPQTVNYEDIDFRVVGIGLSAFDQCSAVTSVVLPNSITYIGAGAFNGTSISSITLPASVTTVDGYAFYNCRSLVSIIFEGSTPPTAKDASFNTYETTVLVVPVGAKSAYQSADVWKNFATIREKDGEKFEKNGIFYTIKSVEFKTVEVTFKGDKYDEVNDEYSGEVVVPQTVNYKDIDFMVVGIGVSAFARCSAVTSVVLPNSITYIESGAFNGVSISAITLPSGVTTIGGYAFYNCSSLASIILEGSTPPTAYDTSFNNYETTVLTVPAGAKSAYQSANVWKKFATIREVGEGEIKDGDKFEKDGIFYAVISVADKTVKVTIKGETPNEFVGEYSGSVVIPQTVNYGSEDFKVVGIGYAAFSDCSGLTSVTIPNSVTSIGESAFSYCYGLTSVEIPTSVTSIGDYAFRNCSGLTSVTIPNSVTSIGDYAFRNCSGLTSVTIPNSVTSIGSEAFRNCSGLTSVTIPSSVTSIGNGAFYRCSGLTSVTIPNSVTSIGNSAFMYCFGLTSVTIPNSVTSIGGSAFYGCTSLASIILEGTTPPAASDDSVFTTYSTTVLIVPAGTKSAYQSADVWKKFVTIEERVMDGVKFEKDGIFYTVISIADKTVEVTFKGETYDEVDNEYQGDVVIPQTVSYGDVDFTVVGVGEKALYGCDNIRRLSVPLTVSYFDKGTINSETLRELYWNSTMAFSKSIFVNPDVATNMILYITAETACDYDGNVVRDGVAEEIFLTDALPLQITTGFKAKRISYNRHFDKVTVPRKPGGWESIVLPFDVQSYLSEEAGEIAPFNSGNAGAKPFMLAQMTAGGFAVATKMKANVPYILVMPNSEVYPEEDNIRGEVVFSAESASGVTVAPTVDAVKSEGKEFDLVPAYEGMERDLAVYALNEESIGDMLPGSAFVSGMREVKPFEAYASVESKPANAKTYFVIGGDDSATDIMRLYDDMFDGLNIDSRNGVLYIESPKAQNIGLYGSDGRLVKVLRLTEGTNTVTGLSKGVYVIGKKKVRV